MEESRAPLIDKPREIYAEWLRILAAFTVVFQHTVTSVWYTVPVDTAEFIQLNFLNSLSRFGVGVFIMISGAFMLSPKYSHPPKKVLTHNFSRIVILLIVWVLVYGVMNAFLKGDCNLASPDAAGCATDLLSTPVLLFTRPATHLWFLYTIAGLYLITPALRVFTANASRRMILYVICIFFFFGLMLPTASHLLAKFTDFSLYKNIGIRGCTTFAGFYLTGFYLSQYGAGKVARRLLYGAAFTSWLVAFVYSTYTSIVHDAPNEYFFGNFRPTTFLMAAAVFILFRSHLGERKTGENQKLRRQDQWLLNVSKCMLGVYLLHPMLIKAFYGMGLSVLDFSPLAAAPITAILIFLLASGLVYLFRKIPWIRKVL